MSVTLELSKHKLSKLAWLSLCISLLIGLSHVRSFPSYNIAVPLIALYTSAQEEPGSLLKSSSICLIIGISSILADVAFCFLWAKEINDGYSGVLKFCLILFIVNMFIKAALVYSTMTVGVSASSGNDNDNQILDNNGSSEDSGRHISASSSPHSKSFDTRQERVHRTPGSKNSFHSNMDIPSSPSSPMTPGVSGLISPGYDPRRHSSYSPRDTFDT